MLAKVPLTICTGDYDRIRALADGRSPVEGCEVNYLTMNPEQTFFRAWNNLEFDVTELSASSYIIARSIGWDKYIAIPAFPSRMFRHSSIYIRSDSTIKEPADLKGKEVGVPVYGMTASLWVRGMLYEDYGVKHSDIHWRTGGLEEGGRKAKFQPNLTSDINVTPIRDDETLSSMLESGEISALVSAREPSCYGPPNPCISRLFPDYRIVEKEWYTRTRMFPIMHLIGIRKKLMDEHPWLASSVLKAFTEAKNIAVREMSDITALAVSLPWLKTELEETQTLMGKDFWRYGFKENLKELETMCRWSKFQGLAARELNPKELFHPATIEQARI
tara:strand:+ start:2741 stop:3736 length:996 start_codon:yes stop_codon:yes gene_type:complete